MLAEHETDVRDGFLLGEAYNWTAFRMRRYEYDAMIKNI